MAKKKLKNLLRRTRVFNLEHPTFKNANLEHPAGKPEALTILPRQVVEVHPDVLNCREVAACLNPKVGRPTLRVIG